MRTSWRTRISAVLSDFPWDSASNDRRMSTYCELELVRMEFLSSPEIRSYLAEKRELQRIGDLAQLDEITKSESGKDIEETLEEFGKASKQLSLRPMQSQWIVRLIHCIAFALIFILMFLATVIWAPIAFLNDSLRRKGVPNSYFPSEIVQRGFMQGIAVFGGVRIKKIGTENCPIRKDGIPTRSIVAFTHASNLDSFITASVVPLATKFAAKVDLFSVPLFGLLLKLWGHIPINRKNSSDAIASLQKAGEIIRQTNSSIGISPEGTRSKSGLLAEFKKGPFHLAKQTGMSVTPVVLYGAYELWPPSQIFIRPGTVLARILPPLHMSETESVDEFSARVRKAMLTAMMDSKDDLESRAEPCKMEAFWFTIFPSMLAILFFLSWLFI